MPIKEMMVFSFGIVVALFVRFGPVHFLERMHQLEMKILNESTHTDDWGYPSIFQYNRGRSTRHNNHR